MYRCNVTNCFEFPGYELTAAHAYMQSCLVFTLLAVNVISTLMASWRLRHLGDPGRTIDNKVDVMLTFAVNLLMFGIFFLPVSVVMMVEDWRHVAMPTSCEREPLL
ncbi:hypothetical protein NHX12_007977 [Muraenolepis orangiensis]|uniref:Uncharacterized protein n=1 Tax=Muraenolepis orangiensis TaxID=630683 RepID=A0A9Q0I9D1_9TELE|nr:hypothetical protein NHX12_007977 [Muraenolepis orangiensis]